MFDKVLSWFGLARKRDLVRAGETREVHFGQLLKAVEDRDLEKARRLKEREEFRVREAEYLRQIALVIDQYGKVAA